jgi:hypothetical protein
MMIFVRKCKRLHQSYLKKHISNTAGITQMDYQMWGM